MCLHWGDFPFSGLVTDYDARQTKAALLVNLLQCLFNVIDTALVHRCGHKALHIHDSPVAFKGHEDLCSDLCVLSNDTSVPC